MADATQQQNKTAWLWWFPPARWLADYSPAWLPSDIVAGITLAAYAIPVSLAYAGLAGLPPQAGMAICLAAWVTRHWDPRVNSPSAPLPRSH